jgi:hypothetical protein
MSLLYPSASNQVINQDGLQLLPPAPRRGAFHNPVSFYDFTTEIFSALSKFQIEVGRSEMVTTNDSNRLFGCVELFGLSEDKSYKMLMGFRASYDSSVSRGIVVGSQVMVCSNLCFNGSLGQVSTKQTTFINSRLPSLISRAVELLPEAGERQARRIETYKDRELTTRQGDALLVESHRRGGLSGSQLATAISEWDTPRFAEHGEHGDSVYKLWNAQTQAVKPNGANSNPQTIETRTTIQSALMDEIAGL